VICEGSVRAPPKTPKGRELDQEVPVILRGRLHQGIVYKKHSKLKPSEGVGVLNGLSKGEGRIKWKISWAGAEQRKRGKRRSGKNLARECTPRL